MYTVYSQTVVCAAAPSGWQLSVQGAGWAGPGREARPLDPLPSGTRPHLATTSYHDNQKGTVLGKLLDVFLGYGYVHVHVVSIDLITKSLCVFKQLLQAAS